jgi:hypothetical protein
MANPRKLQRIAGDSLEQLVELFEEAITQLDPLALVVEDRFFNVTLRIPAYDQAPCHGF